LLTTREAARPLRRYVGRARAASSGVTAPTIKKDSRARASSVYGMVQAPFRGGDESLTPAKPSIAVPPFQNMSGAPEQYFAEGMIGKSS
jgi:hypothetical protein